MENALDYNLEEWQAIMLELKEPSFRAKQVYEWLFKIDDFDKATNLPKPLILKLKERFYIGVKIVKSIESKKDGTIKYLFGLHDGNIVEGVLMRYKYGNTICVSSQVGCRMGCAFCASGIDGLIRNLSSGEILGQVLAVNNAIGDGERAITNIVLMGSGEPLDNYDNVIKFINSVHYGMGVSRRNISISTCGIVNKIADLARDGGGVTLTISLHASNNVVRDSIMPINKKWHIEELVKAARDYFEITGRRVIFEYSMISGRNDSLDYADELSKLLRNFPCHVNLISLNYVKEKGLRSSANTQVALFKERLEKNNISVTLRRTMGSDIDGACGQLRRRVLSESLESGNENR